MDTESNETNPIQKVIEMLLSPMRDMKILGASIAFSMGGNWIKDNIYYHGGIILSLYQEIEMIRRGRIIITIGDSRLIGWMYRYQMESSMYTIASNAKIKRWEDLGE